MSAGPSRARYEEYHPYGSTAWWSNDGDAEVSRKRYRYTGMERDEETGLQCHGVRYYAPWLGRWTSADPIGLGDGVNRFGYCHGGPVEGRDESGLGAVDEVIRRYQVAGAAVAAVGEDWWTGVKEIARNPGDAGADVGGLALQGLAATPWGAAHMAAPEGPVAVAKAYGSASANMVAGAGKDAAVALAAPVLFSRNAPDLLSGDPAVAKRALADDLSIAGSSVRTAMLAPLVADLLPSGGTPISPSGPSPLGPKRWANRYAPILPQELDESRAFASPAAAGTPEFLETIRRAKGALIKWVVTDDGKLVIDVAGKYPEEVPHSVVSGGGPVQAAGEAKITIDAEGRLMGEMIDNHSGHYLPGPDSLDVGVDAFHDMGIDFAPENRILHAQGN